MAHAVGIIGCAPSGTMGLERLAAELATSPLAAPVAIHVFNRTTLFGPGDVYDTAQPDYLLTNVSVGDFDMWAASEPPPIVEDALSLHEWCHRACSPPVPVTADCHVPRALAGRYLAAGFEAIAEQLPAGVSLHRHVGEVFDVKPSGGRYRVVCRAQHPAGLEVGVDCDQLLLATGHTRRRPGAVEESYADFARRHPGCRFVSDVYPVAAMAAGVAGRTVAIKGMSLTFVDAVLALTEGTGGRFERDATGRLGYLPGGHEPARILPFSRTGLPARPRASDITRNRPEPVFCTREALEALRQAAPGDKIDFSEDLWQLYERDMEWAYYRVLMAGTDFERRLDACGDDHGAIRGLIASFHRHPAGERPGARRFDARRLFDPIESRTFRNGADFQAFALRHLRRENAKAKAGAAGDAEKAAVETWRSCRVPMLPILASGGLTAASHRTLQDEIWPRMQQLVFGPTLENMEKILALAESGLLEFSVALAPDVTLCDQAGAFRLRCRRTAAEAAAEILADARVPSFDLARDDSKLYRNLARRGLVREFENVQAGAPAYRPGGLDLTPDGRFVIGADGRANPDISVTGAPIQGCIYDSISPLQQERDHPAGVWAKSVVARLRRRERWLAARPPAGSRS